MPVTAEPLVRVGARAALAVRYAATIHIAVIDHWLRRLT
jgi:hypothetical protein